MWELPANAGVKRPHGIVGDGCTIAAGDFAKNVKGMATVARVAPS
jgi:hypothetical protein